MQTPMNAIRVGKLSTWLGTLAGGLLLGSGSLLAATPPASGQPAAAAVTTPAPPPPATYDELLKQALPARDLTTLLEPLYGHCDDSDDVRRRQCESGRSFLVDYLHRNTFVADSDVAPDTTPYDATAKEVDMEVPGCIACVSPPQIAGQPRYLVTKPPQRLIGGRAVVLPIASHEVTIADRVAADRFVERVVPRLRVQHVFRVGLPFGDAPPVPSSAAGSPAASGSAAKGVLVTSLGHRVYDRCTGEVTAASPPTTSKVAVVPDKSCPQRGVAELSQAELRRQAEVNALPERLTPHQIDQVLAPVQARVHECYVEFGDPSGNAKVNLTIGGEGKLTQIHLPSPFDKADIGLCIRSQLKQTSFPKFRSGSMSIDYVYQVN
jgi:hypothetical protein